MSLEFKSINSITYFVLDKSLDFQGYAELETAMRLASYLIVKETKGTWFNYLSYQLQFTNEKIEIVLYNAFGQIITELYENGWSLNSMGIEKDNQHQLVLFYAGISDPRGNHLPRRCYGHDHRGIRNSIRILREMAQYDCIENYNLSQKNTELKAFYKKLTLEIQALKEETNHPELSQFDNWEQYQLLKENEALQAKLELLTQEKNKLQAMLDNPE